MKTLHIHIKTKDIEASARYYTALFGASPTRQEGDYAKWLLDDPRAHISLSTHCGNPGVDHVGISVDNQQELDATAETLRARGAALAPQNATTCCYAQSNKYWSTDPQGVTWELFHSFGDSSTYGTEPPRPDTTLNPCCNSG